MLSAAIVLLVAVATGAFAGPDCSKGAMPCVELMHPKNHTIYLNFATQCRHQTEGLRCLDRWTRSCLPQGARRNKFMKFVEESLTGHNEFCSNPNNAELYSSYTGSHCAEIAYPSGVNQCARALTVNLLFEANGQQGYCCNRLKYLNCAWRYLPHNCDEQNHKFAMRMYETQIMGLTRARSEDKCAFEDRNHNDFCPTESRAVLSDPIPEPTEEDFVRQA